MISDEKKQERQRAEQRRGGAFDIGAVTAANAALRALIETLSGNVTGYLAIRTEMDPMQTMRALSADRDVGVPIIKAKATPLVFAKWTPDCTLVEGAFKVMTPDPVLPMVPSILIVPMLAFDREGYRLGYGGGFYDRTIEQLSPNITTIGFAFAAQECASVPREVTDQRLDYIVTEKETLSFR
jgi:5-formyltetrahydrofolate cyclo-ligase